VEETIGLNLLNHFAQSGLVYFFMRPQSIDFPILYRHEYCVVHVVCNAIPQKKAHPNGKYSQSYSPNYCKLKSSVKTRELAGVEV
jgi:hypothetical protein